MGLVVCICIALFSAQAQSPEDLHLSDHTVIENVMLVGKAGLSPTKVNIVIRKGVIQDITTSTNYPKDAVVISADSLYAYPAFIDGASYTASPKSESKGKPEKVSNPGNPGYDKAGVTPQNTVNSSIKMDDGSVEKMRKAGFAISHVVPRGKMLSGQGSIVLLNEDETIPYVRKNTSMFGSFTAAKGRVYPSTVIAVMSKHRELFKQAEYAMRYEAQYNANPVGLDRPAYPEQLQSLYPVIEKKMPLFFQAEKTLDISRALTLNEDLKSQMILTEVKQVGPNMSKIKSSGLPVLLSMDLPKSMEEEKDSTKVISDDKQKLIDRKKQAIASYQMQAAELNKNGVKFGFSFLDTKPADISKKVEILLENGMSKDDILRALTMDVAEILGIENVAGSVEKNKLANIILTDGVLFEKKTNIVYTIVEGKMYKYEVKKKKEVKGDKDAKIELAGDWEITVSIPGDEQTAKLRFTKSGDGYSGIMIDDEGDEYKLDNLTVEGDLVTFSFTISEQGSSMEMTTNATVKDDTMEGSLSVCEFGSFPLEGTKTSKPEK